MIALGPVLGGWLAGQGLWRVVFFLNIPLAVITLFALTQVSESKDETAPERLDLTGSLLATLGLAGITYGFIQAPGFGFGDWRIMVSTTLYPAILCWLSALLAAILVEGKAHPHLQEKLHRLKFLFHDHSCPTRDHHGDR